MTSRLAGRVMVMALGALASWQPLASRLHPQQPVAAAQQEVHQVAPGVRHTHLRRFTPQGDPWSIHVLEISRKERSLRMEALRAQPSGQPMRRERPTVMAARLTAAGRPVVAVVNGDYDLAAPYLGISDGLDVAGGAIFTTGKPAWPALGISRRGEPLIDVPQVLIKLQSAKRWWRIGAINKPLRSAHGAGARLLTSDFREVFSSPEPFRALVISRLSKSLPLRVNQRVTGTIEAVAEGVTELPIPAGKIVVAESSSDNSGMAALRGGERVSIEIQVALAGRRDIRDAIAGFPVLVQAGRKNIMGQPSAYLQQRHPRTALCYNDSSVIFAVVDGRQPSLSAGMTLDELADLMVSLGCRTAMNTDGGGSSVMAIALAEGASNAPAVLTEVRAAAGPAAARSGVMIVNSPSDGAERGRGNAWVILQRKR